MIRRWRERRACRRCLWRPMCAWRGGSPADWIAQDRINPDPPQRRCPLHRWVHEYHARIEGVSEEGDAQ